MSLTSIKKADTLILYDLSNLAYAAYYAAEYQGLNEHGKGGPLYLFLKKLISNLKILSSKETAIIFALDNNPIHKKKLLPEYKANRKRLTAEEDPRPLIREALKNTRTYFAECPDNEADDVIASIAQKYKKEKQIIIVSADQDLLQLKSGEEVEIFNPLKTEFFDLDFVKKKFGLKKWKFIPLYKACFGDTSDNIKGSLPRVRKTYVLPVINKGNGTLKDFIELFSKSEQTEKTMTLFQSNLKKLKINYKIVKLNRQLEYNLIKNEPNIKDLKKLLEKNKVRSLAGEIERLL